MPTKKPPKKSFQVGDIVSNGYASDDNPTKIGIVIRIFYRTGQMNCGNHIELTNFRDGLWQHGTDHEHKLEKIGELDLSSFLEIIEKVNNEK